MRKTYKYKVEMIKVTKGKIKETRGTKYIFEDFDSAYDFIIRDISRQLDLGATGMKKSTKRESRVYMGRQQGLYIGNVYFSHKKDKRIDYYIYKKKLERIEV